jgi:hypothetical protein
VTREIAFAICLTPEIDTATAIKTKQNQNSVVGYLPRKKRGFGGEMCLYFFSGTRAKRARTIDYFGACGTLNDAFGTPTTKVWWNALA